MKTFEEFTEQPKQLDEADEKTNRQLEKEIGDFVKSYNKLKTFLKENYIAPTSITAMDKDFNRMMQKAFILHNYDRNPLE